MPSQSLARRSAVASLVALCATSAGALLGSPRIAHACGTTELVDHVMAANPVDVTAPTLTVGEVTVARGWLDNMGYRCQEPGNIAIDVSATDDVSAPATIGYSLELASGALPAGATLPELQRADADGAIHVKWFEGSAAAFEVCFAVRAVDEAGNVSGPMMACADGPPIDEGGGCSIAPPRTHRRSGALVAVSMLIAGGFAARRRATKRLR